MNKLKVTLSRVIPPKDRSTKDPYTLVIRWSAERTPYGVAALCLIVVLGLILSIPPVASFLTGRDMLAVLSGGLAVLSGGLGALAGLFLGFWLVGSLCRDSLNSIAYGKPPASNTGE